MMTAMTFLMITWLHVQTLGKNKKNTKIGEFSCKTNFLNMEFFLFGFKYRKKESICHEHDFPPPFSFLRCSYHQQPLKLVLICYLRGVSSTSSDVCQKVSRGPLMWSHLWSSFGPADMFIHSLKERKKKKIIYAQICTVFDISEKVSFYNITNDLKIST